MSQTKSHRHGKFQSTAANKGSTAGKVKSRPKTVSRYPALIDIHQSTIRRLKNECREYQDLLHTIVNSIDNIKDIVDDNTVNMLREQNLLDEDEYEHDE